MWQLLRNFNKRWRLDRTIADTRKAVRQHPDDPVAVQYMLTAYAKKVDVLREMVDY